MQLQVSFINESFLGVLIFQKLFLLHPVTSVAAKVNSENKVDVERQVIDQGKD